MYFLNPSESSLYDVIIMHELTINEQVALFFLKTHLLLFFHFLNRQKVMNWSPKILKKVRALSTASRD